jgi:hypothetical protein
MVKLTLYDVTKIMHESYKHQRDLIAIFVISRDEIIVTDRIDRVINKKSIVSVLIQKCDGVDGIIVSDKNRTEYFLILDDYNKKYFGITDDDAENVDILSEEIDMENVTKASNKIKEKRMRYKNTRKFDYMNILDILTKSYNSAGMMVFAFIDNDVDKDSHAFYVVKKLSEVFTLKQLENYEEFEENNKKYLKVQKRRLGWLVSVYNRHLKDKYAKAIEDNNNKDLMSEDDEEGEEEPEGEDLGEEDTDEN